MKKVFFHFKNYFLFIFLLLISLYFISADSSQSSFKAKKYFFGTFAFVSATFNNLFLQPVLSDNCNEKEELLARLSLKNELLKSYGLENAELKKMLEYKSNSELSLLTAKIVSSSILPVKSELTIDKGEKDSIKLGMTVISPTGFIGLVTIVNEDFSIVRTFQDSRLKIIVQNERTNLNGLAIWDGKNLIMKNIPTNYDIKIGDEIVTSQYSIRYVHKIPIGVVKSKINSVSGLFSDLIINPFVDINKIRYCFVIKNSDDKLLQTMLKSK